MMRGRKAHASLRWGRMLAAGAQTRRESRCRCLVGGERTRHSAACFLVEPLVDSEAVTLAIKDWFFRVRCQSGHITQAHRFPSEQVKLGRVQAVLRWGTTREGWMLLFLFSHPSFLRFCPVSPCYYPLRVPRQAQLSRCTSNPEPVRLAFKPGARSAPATHK